MSAPASKRSALVLSALPMSLAAIVLAEAAFVPVHGLTDEPRVLVGVFAWLAHDAIWLLAPVATFQLGAAILVALAAGATDARRRALVALGAVLLAAGATAGAYVTLVLHPPMLRHPELALAHAAFFTWLAAALVAVTLGGPRPRILAAVTGMAGAAALHVGNVRVHVDAYPSLHLCAMQLTMLALQTGLAAILTSPRAGGWTWPLRAAVAATVLLTAAAVAARAGWFPAARTPLVTYSLLGQAEVLRCPPGARVPSWLEDGAPPSSLRDPGALARFAAQSGMPVLPEGFDLARLSVLLVSSEATRWDQTSLAQPAAGATPRLRRFAEDGAWWWTQARSPSSRTLESMSSVLAMLPPSAVLVHPASWFGVVAPENLMAAEVFAESGHRTFWVGHDIADSMSRRMPGFEQGFQDVDLVGLTNPERLRGLDERIADAAIEQLEGARPFFGWVFFGGGHADPANDDYSVHFPAMPSATALERHRQGIVAMDAQLGRLLDAIDALGMRDEVVVIFVGDHGEAFGEHRVFHHGATLHEEVVHVPLVVRVPGAPGGVITRPASLTSVLPWLLLAGDERMRAAAAERVERALGPLLRETDGAVVIELLERYRVSSALLRGNEKLIMDLRVDLPTLFDVERDPGERENLFGRDPISDEEWMRRFRGYWRVRESLRDH